MLEFFLALKYLRIQKNRLSSGLIAIAATAVIALVVALLLSFFSITRSMERSWLTKITALSAPVRISPTDHYTSSYYYQADSASESSNYLLQTLGQKSRAIRADPTDPDLDDLSSLTHLARHTDEKGQLRHLASELRAIIESKNLSKREFSVTGGGMRLRMLRDAGGQLMQSFISAVPYFYAIDAAEKKLAPLFTEPTARDYDNLLHACLNRVETALTDQPASAPKAARCDIEVRIRELLSSLEIKTIKTGSMPWRLPSSWLREGEVKLWSSSSSPVLYVAAKRDSSEPMTAHITSDSVTADERTYSRSKAPIFLPADTEFQVEIGSVQGDQWHLTFPQLGLSGWAPIEPFHIASAATKETRAGLLTARVENGHLLMPADGPLGTPILLPKTFRDKGILVGDSGYLSYQSLSMSGPGEERLASYVAGFYDPGLSPLASRLIMAPRSHVERIMQNGAGYDFDKTLGNGFLIWPRSIYDAEKCKTEIQGELKTAGLDPFFKVESFTDYEFTRPFLTQFQSDRQLFTLIAALILLVACCNVFSFLVVLVNDKRADIAILSAMGASHQRITRIFTLAAALIGFASTALGTLLAALFLQQLPRLLGWLAFLQNHPAFNPDLFGVSDRQVLDWGALTAVWIGVPVLCTLAGLVAARKAAKLDPTEVLKS